MLPIGLLAQKVVESSNELDQELVQRLMSKGAIIVIFLSIVLVIFICFVVFWGRNIKRFIRRNRSEPSDPLQDEWYKKPLVSDELEEPESSLDENNDDESDDNAPSGD